MLKVGKISLMPPNLKSQIRYPPITNNIDQNHGST